MSDGSPRLWQRVLWVVGAYTLFFVCYGAANRLIPVEACLDLTLPVDRATPFVPELVYPFWAAYVLIPCPALLVATRSELARAGIAFVVLILISAVLFVLIPVTVPRPTAVPDTVAGALVALIYASDRPVCGFPSLHVSASLLAALITLRIRPRVGLVLLAAWALTAASTLCIKQHVVLDVAGGTALGLVVGMIVWLWPESGDTT